MTKLQETGIVQSQESKRIREITRVDIKTRFSKLPTILSKNISCRPLAQYF